MAARGDEVKVAADAGLGGVYVAEIVRAVDDPEFLVPRREIEDLLVFRKHDERRKAQLGMDIDDVLLSVFNDACTIRSGPQCQGRSYGQQDSKKAATA